MKVTSEALEQFKTILRQQDRDEAYIRIFSSGVGWKGPQLALALDESIEENKDFLEEFEGISIIYDKEIAPHISDKIIDFQEGPQGGFAIISEGPEEPGSCCQ